MPSSALTANGYTSGNCTWWMKNQLPWVPNGWGNAAEWWANAQAQGFQTSQQPQPDAIAVWGPGVDPPAGFGHVARVTAVHPDGTFTVSEMNWKGLGVVDNRNVSDQANLLGFILPPGASPAGGGDPFGVGQAIRSAGSQLAQAGQVGGGGLLVLAGLGVAVLLVLRPRFLGGR